MDLLLGKQPLLAILSNHKKKKGKKPQQTALRLMEVEDLQTVNVKPLLS